MMFSATFWRYLWRQLWNPPDKGKIVMAWRMGRHAWAVHVQAWRK